MSAAAASASPATSAANSVIAAARRPSPAPAPTPTVFYKRDVLKLGIDGSSLPRLVVVTDTHVYVCLPTGGITRSIDVRRIERVTLCPRASPGNDGSSDDHERGTTTSPQRQTSASFFASVFARASRRDDTNSGDAPATAGRSHTGDTTRTEADDAAWASVVTLGIAQEAALALQFLRTDDGDAFVAALRRAVRLGAAAAALAGSVVFHVPGEPGPTDAAGVPLTSLPARRQDPVTPRVLEREAVTEPAPRLSRRTSASATAAESKGGPAGAGPTAPAGMLGSSRRASASSASSSSSSRAHSGTPFRSPDSAHTAEPASPAPLHAEEVRDARSTACDHATRSSSPPVPPLEVQPREPSPPAPVASSPPVVSPVCADVSEAPPLPIKETVAAPSAVSAATTAAPTPQPELARTPSPLRAVPRREAPAAPPQQQQQQQQQLPVPPPLEFLRTANEQNGTAASRDRTSASRGGSEDGQNDIASRRSNRASTVRSSAARQQPSQPQSAVDSASEDHEMVHTPSQDRQVRPHFSYATTHAAPPRPRSAEEADAEEAWLRRREDPSPAAPATATHAAANRARPTPEGLNETAQDIPLPSAPPRQPSPAVADIDVLQAEVAAQAATVAQLRRSLHAHESLLLELAEVREERRRLRAAAADHAAQLRETEDALAAAQQEVEHLRRQHAQERTGVEERLRQAHRAELEAVQDAFEEYDARMSAYVDQLQREHREEAARWQHERRTLHYQLDEEREARQQLEHEHALSRHPQGVAPPTAGRVAAAAQREAQRRLATSPHGQRVDDPRTVADARQQVEAKLQRYEAQRPRAWPSPPRRVARLPGEEESARVVSRAAALPAGSLVSPPSRQQPLRTPRFSAHRLFDEAPGEPSVEQFDESEDAVIRRPPPTAEARPSLSYRGEHVQAAPRMEAPERCTYTMHRRTYV